jgi:hypothetical protein
VRGGKEEAARGVRAEVQQDNRWFGGRRLRARRTFVASERRLRCRIWHAAAS